MAERQPEVILVTGAAGVIGRRLTQRLAEEGRHVHATDLVSPEPVLGVLCSEGDLTLPDLPALAEVGTVVHLAAIMSNSRDVPGEGAALVQGNLGTLLGALRLAPNARRLVLASTMIVYGPPDVLPVREDHPRRPGNLYGAAKVAAEECARIWGEGEGRSACWLRISSVYGPDDPPGRAIPSFARAVRSGVAPNVGGESVRDYIHVDDVVEAIVCGVDGEAPGPFNVATGEGTGTLDLARIAIEAASLDLEPNVTGTGRGMDIVLDVTRAREELGFSAEITMRDGMGALIKEDDAG
jgi:UDP-glucose 4-epimerase